MVRLQSWSFGEHGVLFRCHYSQVHSDVVKVKVPSVGQIELSNHLLDLKTFILSKITSVK